MNLLITSPNALMFRDARPFGDFGRYSGGLHKWPMPNTVAGALRTREGFARSADFFDRANPRRRENIAAALAMPLEWMLPVCRPAGGEWQYYFPRPADAIIVQDPGDNGKITVARFALSPPMAGEGSDLPWKDWLYPITRAKGKPAPGVPELWNDASARAWWEKGAVSLADGSKEGLGLPLPPQDIRMHVGIDAETFTAAEGKLFASGGVRLERKVSGKGGAAFIEYGIACSFDGKEGGGLIHLGGERRTANVQALSLPAPTAPAISETARYLRLQLLTPGNFGAWAPQWLLPGDNSVLLPWGAPREGFPCKLRLRSAMLGGWQAASGWDYARHKPKATRKLVPAGSIYVVELEDPSKAQAVRNALWLKSLCPDGSQEACDGFGVTAVGNADFLVANNN